MRQFRAGLLLHQDRDREDAQRGDCLKLVARGSRAPLGMPLDVYRGDDGSHYFQADLPGVDPDSIEVTVDSGT